MAIYKTIVNIRLPLMLCLMAFCLNISYAGENNKRLITLKFADEPLPSALKRLEKAGRKSILFTYKETERFRVTATVENKTQAEALRILLSGKPFAFVERNAYFVVQYSESRQRSVSVRGRVTDQNGKPMAYANVVMLAAGDKSYISGCVTEADGTFAMPSMPQKDCLLRVSFVGYTTVIVPCRQENSITLKENAMMLKGVEVKASRPMVERRGSTIVANVAGTPLSMMGSAADMIGSLPFVTGDGDNFSVIGRGGAEIYINGRKVRDTNELGQLRATEIQQAEIIMNPGARYSSDVGAVIRLKTIRLRGQGLSGLAYAEWSQGHEGEGREGLSLNYRTGGLDVFVKGNFKENSFYIQKQTLSLMNTSSVWTMMSDNIETGNDSNFNGEVGFNYEPDSRQSFGVRYVADKSLANSSSHITGNTILLRDGDEYDNIETESETAENNGWNHSVNGYYTGTFGKWSIDFNADYLGGCSRSWQVAANNDEVDAASYNDVRNSLYAAKLVVTAPLLGGEVAFGTEETFTDRKDRFTQSGFSADADDHLQQQFYSAFVDYTLGLGRFTARAGLRYEHQRTKYYEAGVLKAEQSPTYNDLIPSASVDYSHGDWNFSLAYRLLKLSPLYRMLSSATSYISKYMYRNGNPLLVPQKHNYFTIDGGWRWINFSIWYDYAINMYTSFFKPYDEDGHPGIMLETMASIPYTNMYGMSVELTPKIGIWQPRLSASIDWYDSDARSLGIPYLWNRPVFDFVFYNSLTFSHGWLLNLKARLGLRGKQSYTIKQQYGTVSLRVVKTFCKDKSLRVAISADDIFNTGRDRFTGYGDRTYYDSRTWSDTQRIGISVNYTFNATKTKYKGKGAGESEKQRL